MSAMHTCRRDPHEAGLQDDCLRCVEHAEDPIPTLDEEMLRGLVRLAQDRDRLAKGRSETELVAAAKILTTLEHVGRLAEVDPAGVERYLRERWHLRVRIQGRE
jgi:hypothetical protein